MSFGGGPFGGGIFGGTTPGPWTVEEHGGHPVVLSIPALADGDYEVHVGPLGSASDPYCASGIAGTGKGRRITAKDGLLGVFTPVLPVGGPYRFTVIPWGGGASTITAALLTVKRRWFRSKVYEVRKRLSGWWSTGKKTAEKEAAIHPEKEELLEAEVETIGTALDELAGHRITRLTADILPAQQVATAVSNGTSADGLTVFRDGALAWPAEVQVGRRFRVLTGPRTGQSARINTVMGLAIILDAGIAGAFTSETWEVVIDAATEAQIESAVGWDAAGEVAIGEVLYRYGSRTDIELRELKHWNGEVWVTGAKSKALAGDEVHDAGRTYSGIDRLRKSTQLAYAQDEDLDTMGRVLQVLRPDRPIDREAYRALVMQVAYSARGHRDVLRRALNATVGVGSWERFIDLAGHVRDVYFRRVGAELESSGRWYLSHVERRQMLSATTVGLLKAAQGVMSVTLAPSGGVRLIAQGTGATSADGLTVTGPANSFPTFIQKGDTFEVLDGPRTGAAARLKTRTSATQIVLEGTATAEGLGGRIDGAAWRITRRCSIFEWFRPSDERIIDYDGDTGTAPWAFVGAAETDVAVLNGEAIVFTVGGGAPPYYRHAARVTPAGRAVVEMTFAPWASFSAASTAGRQFGIWLEDGSKRIAVGCIRNGGGTIDVGFIDTVTGEVLAGTSVTAVAYQTWINIRVEKQGNANLTKVRLYANNVLITTANYSDFETATMAVGNVKFGAIEGGAGLTAHVRQVDYWFESSDDFMLLPVASCSITAPDRILSGANPFVAGDVGKSVRVVTAPTENGVWGTAVGEWVGATLIGAGELQVAGKTRDDGRVTDVASKRFDSTDPGAFRYPHSLGMQVEILTGGNVGVRTIQKLIDPVTGADFTTFDPRSFGVGGGDKSSDPYPNNGFTSACIFSSAVAVEDPTLIRWRMVPVFPNSAGTNAAIDLCARGSVAGTTVTLARSVSLWSGGYVPVLEVRYWLHRSGFVLPEHAGAAPAAYLADSWGWVRDVLVELMAPGYRARFDRLFRDAAGLHVIDP